MCLCLQVTEELEKVKQEMDERGSSMTDGGIYSLYLSLNQPLYWLYLSISRPRVRHFLLSMTPDYQVIQLHHQVVCGACTCGNADRISLKYTDSDDLYNGGPVSLDPQRHAKNLGDVDKR